MIKWTPEMDAVLLRHYNRGEYSAADIGSMLKVSKNAVIGRARRLRDGVTGDPMKQGDDLFQQALVQVKQRKPVLKLRSSDPPKDTGCQWIEGDPLSDPIIKCGEPLKHGSRFSFCAEHHKVVFRKPIPQGERQHFKFQRGR